LAHELAADGLLPDVGKTAHRKLHKVPDGGQVTYAEEIEAEQGDILKVGGKMVNANAKTQAMTFNGFIEEADYAVIEDAYERAQQALYMAEAG